MYTVRTIYNTLVELTKAADFASPERFWTDPAKAPPKPPPPPPPPIVVAQMDNASKEKIKAAEIAQQEVESQRKMEMDKYAIDSNAGLDIINKQIDHGHQVAMQQLAAGHEAALKGLDAKLDSVTNAGAKIDSALDNTTKGMAKHTVDIGHVHAALNETLEHVKRQGQLATGRKVVRRNKKGEVEGVDVMSHDGKVLQSHTAVKDEHGRITGMQ